MALIKLESAEQFESFIQNEKALVWLSAEWCSPCRQIAPALSEIAEKRDVVKVDIDQFPDIAKKYNVMTIPTLIDFRVGEPSVTSIGVKPKAALLRDFAV